MLIGLVLLLAWLAGQASPARAALVYQRLGSPTIVSADDDGSLARRLAHGSDPVVSPDGRYVVYRYHGARVISIRGGRSRLLVKHPDQGGPPFAVWSPDAQEVVIGQANQPRAVVVQVKGWRRRAVSLSPGDSYIGATFSPNSSRLLLSTTLEFSHSSDPMVVEATATGKRLKTLTGLQMPVWGPRGLACATFNDAESGGQTFGTVRYRATVMGASRELLRRPQFVAPVGWSARGDTLLIAHATASGGNQEEAILYDFTDNTARSLPTAFVNPAQTAGSPVRQISRDGTTVLGLIGDSILAERADGNLTTLATHATNPSWSR